MLPAQQREAVGRFEILLFWLQEHTKKYNQMIISSINEVKIYHSLTYCTKLVNLCLSMLSLPTIEMYTKPSLPGELVYINAKIGKVLRTSYQLSIKQGLAVSRWRHNYDPVTWGNYQDGCPLSTVSRHDSDVWFNAFDDVLQLKEREPTAGSGQQEPWPSYY